MLRFILLLLPISIFGQNVLHYTETSGFDHNTRTVSLAMFQDIALLDGYSIVDDQDGSEFNTAINLMQYDVIVFSNTSGDAILDSMQRANFESYVAMGGGVMGIHAASDTYRHSTANGGNTGTWDFYAETMGGSVQQSPNHVSGTPSYSMDHIGLHQSTANLPDPWQKNEEYYYWANGYLNADNTDVLRVEETTGPNGQVNPYDSARAMSWYRTLTTGSKVFYTALGHAQSNFTSDSLFRQHIRDALDWMMPVGNGIKERSEYRLTVTQIGHMLSAVWSGEWGGNSRFLLVGTDGRTEEWEQQGPSMSRQMDIASGYYRLFAWFGNEKVHKSFFWSK